MTTAFLAVLMATSSRAAVPAAPAAPALVKMSTAAAVTDPEMVYTTEKLRDPFRQVTSASGGGATHPFSADDFSIHNLSLRGMMKDRAADYALFVDPSFGVAFVLRGGRLYDGRGKVVPGVTGSLNIKQKTAHLMTRESDVQTFRLGEEGAQ